MTAITRQNVCDKIAAEFNLDSDLIDELMINFFEVFKKAIISGDKIELRNFGVFQLVERKAKIARNLKTNEPIALPVKKYLSFKPGKEMKEQINQK
ncbi:integration host factor subunit beta [Candidatus Dependentiae bacterium]|nr:integration host factor subunit beta [Candidatus Dependentiae bacterium]